MSRFCSLRTSASKSTTNERSLARQAIKTPAAIAQEHCRRPAEKARRRFPRRLPARSRPSVEGTPRVGRDGGPSGVSRCLNTRRPDLVASQASPPAPRGPRPILPPTAACARRRSLRTNWPCRGTFVPSRRDSAFPRSAARALMADPERSTCCEYRSSGRRRARRRKPGQRRRRRVPPVRRGCRYRTASCC